MPYLGISGLEFEKDTVIFEINVLECVETKMPVLGIFGLQLENDIVIFEICTLEFV